MDKNCALEVAVERALDEDYLLPPRDPRIQEVIAAGVHPRWHGPLLVECHGDLDELHSRMEQAGVLWLGSLPFAGHTALILTNVGSGTSYLFQREQAPRNQSVIVGPVEAALAAGGQELGRNGVRFIELERGFEPAVLRAICEPDTGT